MSQSSDERQVYINGEYFPESEARISVFDSAVMLGDTATESTRTFLHRPFKLDEHLRRLYISLKIMRINPGLTIEELRTITLEVLERNLGLYAEDEDLWIVHNISRGAYPPSGDQSIERRPTIIIHTAPLDLTYWAEFYVRGCHAVTPPSRMIPAQALDPKVKNRSRLAYTLAELEAKLIDPRAQGLLLDLDGFLAENKGGNFFLVQQGTLKTPPTWQALAGVTRQTTLEIAQAQGIPVEICPLQPYDVYAAEEAFFTSTPYCIMPATKFNGVPIGDGRLGRLTRSLLEGWNTLAGFDIVDRALRKLQPPLRDELLAEWHNP
ncbi:MAG: aminotransferase class IV [Candidatus Zipacnadales bacterium]